MTRFRILRGTHSQKEMDPNNGECEKCDKNGRVVVPRKQGDWPCPACLGTHKKHIEVSYSSREGDKNIIDSPVDLEAKFGHEKFQNLDRIGAVGDNESALQRRIRELEDENAKLRDEEDPGEYTEAQLKKMTVDELRTLAEKCGVEDEFVAEAGNKGELINLIQSQLDTA